MSLPEIHRDDTVLVVDKPAGWLSQPDRAARDESVLTWAKATYGHATLPHRLDRPASGLLAVSIAREADGPLAEVFRTHAARRVYRAVLAGTGPAAGDRLVWEAPLDGKDAATEVAVLAAASGLLAVEVTLRTGRTHQIRRHAAMAGLPLVGDRRHGGPAGSWWPRLALHAWRLAFVHPLSQASLDLEAALPGDLVTLWSTAGG